MLWWCLPLLLTLLHESASQDLACMVSSSDVDWTQTFNDTCLNFSGLGLSLPRSQPLRATYAQVLDLSSNGLQALPGIFFANLENLKTLIVTHNPLASVDPLLALRCDLEVQADCSCGLASWHAIRQDNCSEQQLLLCLHPATGAPQNLSTFLQASCPPGLALEAIGALVAGTVLLVLAVGVSLLVWRLHRRWRTSEVGLGKTQNSQDAPGSVTGFLPRYSSRQPSAKVPDTLPDSSTLVYENVFIGQPAEDCSWSAPGSPAGDSDCYMNYTGADLDSQPVYCNLESLGRAPRDDEDCMDLGH
ncbi:leucine-rich repeat-containing protein 25 [Acomys russatus]|uniref:leucine-rich repeat-containing protein 25 n=1 Tax=Acomys russatus TaxID=60746 RepID=UPI0021E1FDDE|nr:leucine-rich repeat-containing protein 25 [Acomys russatus]